jgi:hypothetical protein
VARSRGGDIGREVVGGVGEIRVPEARGPAWVVKDSAADVQDQPPRKFRPAVVGNGHPSLGTLPKERELWIYHSTDSTVLIEHSTGESHCLRVLIMILGRRGSRNH